MNIKNLKEKILKESALVKKGIPLSSLNENGLSLPVQTLKMSGKKLDQELFNNTRNLKHLHNIIPKPNDRLSLYAITQVPAKIMSVLLWLEDKLATGQDNEANPVEKKLANFFSKLSPMEGALEDLLHTIGLQDSLFEDKDQEKDQKEYNKEAETEDDYMEFANEKAKKKCLKEDEVTQELYDELADDIEDLLDSIDDNIEDHGAEYGEDPTPENIDDLKKVKEQLEAINDSFDNMFETKSKGKKKK